MPYTAPKDTRIVYRPTYPVFGTDGKVNKDGYQGSVIEAQSTHDGDGPGICLVQSDTGRIHHVPWHNIDGYEDECPCSYCHDHPWMADARKERREKGSR